MTDRIELVGHLLQAGHPVCDADIGQADPVGNGSQNPVGYCDLPEEIAFLIRPCACGCGEESDRDFLPGHDVRAFQARVREHFPGRAGSRPGPAYAVRSVTEAGSPLACRGAACVAASG